MRPERSTCALLLCLAAPWACSTEDGAGSVADVARPDLGARDAAFDAPVFDVREQPDADAETAAGRCRDDALGPTSFSSPHAIDGTTTLTGLSFCPGEDEWFAVPLDEGDRLEATLAADAGLELDLSIWGADRRVLARSESAGSAEQAAVVASGADLVRVRVYGQDSGPGAYSLSLSVRSFQDGCAGDPEEPNDDSGAALSVALPYTLESRICFEDADWFRITLPAGAILAARLDLDHDLGDLDLWIRDESLAALAASESQLDWEGAAAGPFETARELFVEVAGYRGAVNTYALELALLDGAPVDMTVSGILRYEDRPFDAGGFTGELVPRPVPGAPIELVRDFDGTVVAESETGGDGRYALRGALFPGFVHHLRVVATTHREGLSARVEDRSEANQLYALASEPFAPTQAGAMTVDLLATAASPAGGAFNILAVTHAGFAFLGPLGPPVEARVVFRWEPGRAWPCRSCYSEGVISLGGQVEDADEYDDDIVLHELGHFFQDLWDADDSPGGSHEGEQLDPRLAWGEGSATFLSSWIQADPEYIDLYIDSVRLRDLEIANEDAAFWGTSGGLSGDVSEYLVASILWDAVDAGDGEAADGIEMADAAMGWLLAEYLASRSVDHGAGGIDLADWLNGTACSYPETNAGIAALCEDREYPWDPASDADCRKAAEPSAAVLVARHGRLWLETDRSGSTAVRIYVFDDAGVAADELACEEWPCALSVGPRPELAVVATGRLGDEQILTSWTGSGALSRFMGDSVGGHSRHGPVRVLRAGRHHASTRFLPRFLAR